MKKIKHSYIKIIISSVLAVSLLASCSPDKKPSEEILVSGKLLPNITTEMQDYRFWSASDKKSDETLLTAEEIDTLVTSIKKSIPNSEINLSNSSNVISGEELVSLIEGYTLPPYEYVDGKLKNSKFESNLVKTMGTVSIPKEVNASYGILVSNTPLKILPTSSVLMKSATDTTSDYLLLESLKLGAGVLVYHKTYDEKYSFVQSSKGFGWVLSSSIATTSKEEFDSFLSPADFIIVTSDKLALQNTPKNKSLNKKILDMGTKLPITQFSSLTLVNDISPVGNYQVSVPLRNSNGNLTIAKAFVPVNDDVSLGYLPFTKDNLLKQVLSLTGSTAGNNGYLGNRDSGLTIEAVYSVFGIDLPDNFDYLNQIKTKKIDFSTAKAKDKEKQIKKLTPGSILLSDDHMAIYVGTYDKNIIISHVVDKVKIDDKMTAVGLNVLSNININLDENNTFLETCKYAIDFTLPDEK